MITLEGTGASGNQIKRAYGVYIQNEGSIRGARIKVDGFGGKQILVPVILQMKLVTMVNHTIIRE